MRTLKLDYNPALDGVAIAHLSAANWQLESLNLLHIPVTAAVATELGKLELPKLQEITLSRTGLTAAALSELAKADWPSLRRISLSCNDLGAVEMQYFCTM